MYKEIISIQNKATREAAICIIVETKGSTPRKAGTKMIVYEDKVLIGSIGGGALEEKVIKNALSVIKNGEGQLFKHNLLHQHNMCCGGTVCVYIEKIEKTKRLFIFGAGHTGKALAKYAIDNDLEVYLIDDRKEYLDVVHTENVNKLHLHYSKALNILPFNKQTYIVIMTYSHPYDRDILAYCLKKPHAYLGMIGSKRKVSITKKKFIAAGIATEKELERVDMPIGVNINANTPEEIAISIIAKIIQTKNSPIYNESPINNENIVMNTSKEIKQNL